MANTSRVFVSKCFAGLQRQLYFQSMPMQIRNPFRWRLSVRDSDVGTKTADLAISPHQCRRRGVTLTDHTAAAPKRSRTEQWRYTPTRITLPTSSENRAREACATSETTTSRHCARTRSVKAVRPLATVVRHARSVHQQFSARRRLSQCSISYARVSYAFSCTLQTVR